MKPYPLKFVPIAQRRIWGGHKLKSMFNEKEDAPIGEYWVLSGHPSAQSVIANGDLAGKTLAEATRDYPEYYLGNSRQDRFPLLIKFLEAMDDLSVQVHPDDQYALTFEQDYGKTEAWYILEVKEDAKIVHGHSFQNRNEYRTALQEQRIPDYLRYQSIAKDQAVFVPSGTLHALLGGTILIEIQQTSDVTYRVFDWDRVDEKGQARELHTEKAGEVIHYDPANRSEGDTERRTLQKTDTMQLEHLVSCTYFVIHKLAVSHDRVRMQLGRAGNPEILIVISGEGALSLLDEIEPLPLRPGNTVLVPSSMTEYYLHADSGMELLRVYY